MYHDLTHRKCELKTCDYKCKPVCFPKHKVKCQRRALQIGLGTFGATLAKKITDNPRYSVTVLESGSPFRKDPNVTSFAGGPTVATSQKYSWIVSTSPDFGLAGRSYEYRHGDGDGGSSSHNFGQRVTGSKLNHDQMVTDTGNPIYKHENHVKANREIENWVGPPAPERGLGGPLTITAFPGTVASQDVSDIVSNLTGVTQVVDYNDTNSESCVSNFRKSVV